MADIEKENELRKSMGEPIGFDISEPAMKIKRNLLLVSSVVLILIFGGVEAVPGVSIFGISLRGVTSTKLMIGLAAILLYTTAHYTWYCYELYSEWAIRLTGAKLGFVTAGIFGGEGMDYPSNPKQSTLYNWWKDQSRALKDYKELRVNIEDGFRGVKDRLDSIVGSQLQSSENVEVSQSMERLREAIDQFKYTLGATESVINSARVPVSLSRFDRRFGLLLKSQNLRVLLVDIALPLALAGFSGSSIIKFFVS